MTLRREVPTCSKCGKTSVLPICRDCCSAEELAALPLAPWETNE